MSTDTRQLYGFYSARAVAAGHGSAWYNTPNGGEVEVSCVDEDPAGASYLWVDKKAVGAVGVWLRTGEPDMYADVRRPFYRSPTSVA